jgi:hypothetical protein
MVTKAKPPSQLNIKPPPIPRNAQTRRIARDNGLISGWMKNRKRGAPPKTTPLLTANDAKRKRNNKKQTARDAAFVTKVTTDIAAIAYNQSTSTDAAASATAATAASAPPSSSKSNRGRPRKHSSAASKSARAQYDKPKTKEKKEPIKKGKYTNWRLEPYASALAKAVDAKLRNLDPHEAAGAITIPDGTLRRAVKAAKEAAAKKGGEGILYLDEFHRESKGDSKMLTTEEDRRYIQQLIVMRDMRNNGMTRHEVLGVIQMLTGATFDQAEQHWYYLRRKKLLPELKGHGALRSAQATTTKRTGVTTEKLQRWDSTIEATLRELDRLNGHHKDWKSIRESNKIDHFWGNMDETNMMASEGMHETVQASLFVLFMCHCPHIFVLLLLA